MRGDRGAVIRRYALMQVPGYALALAALLLLRFLVNAPFWVYVAVIAALVAKDIVFFPFLKEAYAGCEVSAGGMSGLEGKVLDTLSPEGSVIVRGEIWRAQTDGIGLKIGKGEPVRVTGIRGMTLLVEPCVDNRKETMDRKEG